MVRVAGTYDDAVRRATQEAQDHGWTVISDTAWPGYERIPKLIMLGYTRLMDEVARTLPDSTPPDLIFVPGGVGGLLAAVARGAPGAGSRHLEWSRSSLRRQRACRFRLAPEGRPSCPVRSRP